jgi:hypothetical protein
MIAPPTGQTGSRVGPSCRVLSFRYWKLATMQPFPIDSPDAPPIRPSMGSRSALTWPSANGPSSNATVLIRVDPSAMPWNRTGVSASREPLAV